MLVAQNAYWSSPADDDLGDPKKEIQFKTDLVQWADLSALNTMPRASVQASATLSESNGEDTASLTLTNPTNHIAFFLRAEITTGPDGKEILPITYEDNYLTLFPHETRVITASFHGRGPTEHAPSLRLEGYNVEKQIFPLGSKQ